MRKDQYILKNAYRRPITLTKIIHSKNPIPLDDDFSFDDDGFVVPEGISFCDPKVCSAILCNYNELKTSGEGHFDKDTYFMMCDFDDVLFPALADYPLYNRIVEYKIAGLQNVDIQEELEKELPAHVVDDIVEQSVKGMGTMLNIAIFGLLFVLFLIAKFL